MSTNPEAGAELNAVGIPRKSVISKSRSVREVFENAPHYLKSRRLDMMMRMEAVRTFAASIERRHIWTLDVAMDPSRYHY
jgi:hypothetical protein